MDDNIIELEVGTGPRPGEYTVRVLRSVSGGEPTGTLALDVEELVAQRPQIEATVLSSSVSARRVTPVGEQPIRRIGLMLFESLFSGSVGGAYRGSLGVSQERGQSLRVVLRLNAPGLAALPWETLFDPETGAYLCRKEPLVRHVQAPFTPDALRVSPPLRILGLVASPRGLPLLDVEAEQRRLTEALRPHIDAGRVELVWLADVSWDGLHAKLLEEVWHVLHFIGHGDYDTGTDEGVLALVGKDGRADFVDASSLADLFDEAEPTPRLVVLNSCLSGAAGTQDLFSGTAAALVHSGIHAVAAMQFAISDVAAIAFARSFYTALASGRGIDEAVRSGRIGILGIARGTLEWLTPVLYLRGGGTKLFAFAPGPPSRALAPEPDAVDVRQAAPRPVSSVADGPPSAVTRPTPEAAGAFGGDIPGRGDRGGQVSGLGSPRPSRESSGTTAAPTPDVTEPDVTSGAGRPPIGATWVPRGELASGEPDRVRRKRRRLLTAAGAGVVVVGGVTAALVMLPEDGSRERTDSTGGTVDVEIPSTQAWTDAQVECEAGDVLDITATGTVLHNKDAPESAVGPDGTDEPFFRQWNVPGLPDANTVALIGSLDRDQPYFVVGSATTYTCPQAGGLFLGINDVGLGNNSGEFIATIKQRTG